MFGYSFFIFVPNNSFTFVNWNYRIIIVIIHTSFISWKYRCNFQSS